MTRIEVLGVGISATTYDEVVQLVIEKAIRRQPLTVTALAVHGLTLGRLHKAFGDRLRQFDVVAPDGQPVRWAMNALSRVGLKERVYGPTLMWKICERAAAKQVAIYLYGSHDHVLQALRRKLLKAIPHLRIVGMQRSLFRPLSRQQDEEHIRMIHESGAGIVFVGLGCPLQENWTSDHRTIVSVPLVAVGAAFDFLSGKKAQAPDWMQATGLEWLFRLTSEPRRLWKRYACYNSCFVLLFLREFLRTKLVERLGDSDPLSCAMYKAVSLRAPARNLFKSEWRTQSGRRLSSSQRG